MTKPLCLAISLLLLIQFSFACLNTYQLKLFPVGIFQKNIVSVDFQIVRTSRYEGDQILNLEHSEPMESTMWILYPFISNYDQNQKLISAYPLDTSFAIGENYSDTLQSIYANALSKIKKDNPSIELFTPEYISFCGFHQNCNNLKLYYDSIANKDYLIYKGEKFPISILADSTYYGLKDRDTYIENTASLAISSVRVYKTKNKTLVIGHVITGDEWRRGLFTNDESKVGQTEFGEIILSKEHKPDFKFKEIRKATYQEPVLHHAYGFDAFLVK